MARVRLCPGCGAALRLVREHEWLDNGTIIQRKNPDHRMVFFEINNLVGTFREIEKIIGMPIERIIIEAKRRATFDFISNAYPGVVKWVVRVLVGIRPVVRSISALGKVMGYGDINLKKLRRVHGKGDYVTMTVENPYCIELFCGDTLGSFEAIDLREGSVSYREISPDLYEVTAFISRHPVELQERLKARPYSRKPGDISLERCQECGGPRDLQSFRWDTERGIITNRDTGWRMAMFGPATVDAIFEELERELGEEIPRVVVEAQRRFVKSGVMTAKNARGFGDFRSQMALRGLGNVVRFEVDEKRLSMRIENPCMHLLLAGLALGIFEVAFGCEGDLDWHLDEEGDMHIEVRASA